MRGWLVLLGLALPAWGQDFVGEHADQEQFKALVGSLGKSSNPTIAGEVRMIKRLFERPDARIEPGSGTEVHGVAVFHAAEVQGGRPGGHATVRVVRPGNHILVLSSRTSVRWQVETAPGAHVEKVVLCVAPKQKSTVRGAKVLPLVASFALTRHHTQFPMLQRSVARKLGRFQFASYLGVFKTQNAPIVVGSQNATWRRQMLLTQLRNLQDRAADLEGAAVRRRFEHVLFPVIVRDGRVRGIAASTVAGYVRDTVERAPNSARDVVIDPRNGRRYFVSYREILVEDASGRPRPPLALPDSLPQQFGQPMLAFDVRRRRLVATSMNNHIAAYDVDRASWTRLNDPPVGPRGFWSSRSGWTIALTYDFARDCFWNLRLWRSEFRLLRIGPYGDEGRTVTIRLPKEEHNRMRVAPTLRVAGDQLVLMHLGPQTRPSASYRSYLIDPKTGAVTAQFVFRSRTKLEPPPPAAWDAAWTRLVGPDPYAAIESWRRGDAAHVAYLRKRWEEWMRVEDDIEPWIADLGVRDPARRGEAFARLVAAGPGIRPRLARAGDAAEETEARRLRRALLRRIDELPDVRRRLMRILDGMDAAGAPSFLRQLRDGS